MLSLILDRNLLFFSRSEDEDASGRTKAMPSIKTGQKEKKVYLAVVEGENFGEEYECKDKETAIGRSSGNDIVINNLQEVIISTDKNIITITGKQNLE